MSESACLHVRSPGTLTTVQEWPGRRGLWEVGVPPSGPMDDRSFRLGNRLVGNHEGAAGLEITVTGPALVFPAGAQVAVTGAPIDVSVDGEPQPTWCALDLAPGAVLRLGAVRGAGMRAYLLVAGGIDSVVVHGSRSAFPAGGMGQPPLRVDDVVPIGGAARGPQADFVVAPSISGAWSVRVISGPQGAPDILSEESLSTLLGATWTVHHHSDRTGLRLDGPMPEFTRADGGDAGLHPSNILDSAYGIGTIMLTGDTAVIVGVDGPSLGGFAAIAQIIEQDLWTLGQMRPGDIVRLRDVTAERSPGARRPVLVTADQGGEDEVSYRRAGERALLVEFGAPQLDLRSRVRAHVLQQALREAGVSGVTDLTPGVRSLHVQFDPSATSLARVVDAVAEVQDAVGAPDDIPIATRTVEMPLAWRDPDAMRAVERYATTVRPDAPWCPDNIEFIRRVNGLRDEDAVRDIVFAASYLVLGLGDVYLGAPVALPVDPRHRLVTTKYNPVRTWTPPNAVGIGGAFMCVYGMEGPGGYQLVGRTAPIWSEEGALLAHFDQIRFVEVDAEELRSIRADGDWQPRTVASEFSLAAHAAFLAEHDDAISAFRSRRLEAFRQEREAWKTASRKAA